MFAVAIVVIFNPSLLLDSLPCERGFEDRYFVFAIITVHPKMVSVSNEGVLSVDDVEVFLLISWFS